jgi:hypothetical protein
MSAVVRVFACMALHGKMQKTQIAAAEDLSRGFSEKDIPLKRDAGVVVDAGTHFCVRKILHAAQPAA